MEAAEDLEIYGGSTEMRLGRRWISVVFLSARTNEKVKPNFLNFLLG